MQKNRLNVVVGLFVILSIVALMGTIIVLGGRNNPLAPTMIVTATFKDVSGLIESASVRYRGLDIGSVKRIYLPPNPSDPRVFVDMVIDRSTGRRLARNALPTIRTLGLLGDKYVEIQQGNLDEGTLEGGETLVGEDPLDFGGIIAKGQQIVENVEQVTGKAAKAIDLYLNPATAKNLYDAIEHVENIVREIRQGKGMMHAVIYEPGPRALLDDTRATAASLRESSARVASMINDVKKGPGTLHSVIYGKEFAVTMDNLSRAAGSLATVVREIETGKGVLHGLIYEKDTHNILDELGQTAKNLNATSSDLRVLMGGMKEGRGTMGALLQDPALYEDMRALLGGANRSAWSRFLIRQMIENAQDEARKDVK